MFKAAKIGTDSDVGFYARELRSEECQCGRRKKPGQSLCLTCFKRLPLDLRKRLYLRIGQGYEAAYETAVLLLSKEPDEDETAPFGRLNG